YGATWPAGPSARPGWGAAKPGAGSPPIRWSSMGALSLVMVFLRVVAESPNGGGIVTSTSPGNVPIHAVGRARRPVRSVRPDFLVAWGHGEVCEVEPGGDEPSHQGIAVAGERALPVSRRDDHLGLLAGCQVGAHDVDGTLVGCLPGTTELHS